MKRIVVLMLIGIMGIAYLGCKKKSADIEPPIAFEMDADLVNVSFSDRFNFAVRITSAMPLFGVKVGSTAKEEISGQVVEQELPLYSNTAQAGQFIKNLPRQKWVIVTVKVSSFRDTLNCATKTFKVVYK